MDEVSQESIILLLEEYKSPQLIINSSLTRLQSLSPFFFRPTVVMITDALTELVLGSSLDLMIFHAVHLLLLRKHDISKPAD